MPAMRHVKKFGEVTPPGRKAITANTLNFKPIFECSLLKIVWGPSPLECAIAGLGHSLARVKICAGSSL